VATAITSAILAASVGDVWELLGDFNGWPLFLPRIAASTLDAGSGRGPVGAVRVLTLSDGSTIRERLVDYDQSCHELAYVFDGQHPFPVRRYTGRIQLFPLTETGDTYVYWTGTFDCDAADEEKVALGFCRTYAAFLADLGTYLKRPTSR